MSKTGGFANFAMGEKRTGAVLLPTHFTTASTANKAGKKFGDLVRVYAAKGSKVLDNNNFAVDDIASAKEEMLDNFGPVQNIGYGPRMSATGDAHPLFNSDTLNMTDSEMDTLVQRLNNAQENGNVLHEMAFSMRGDWLVENMLFDPETKQLDQDKLKRAEQHMVKDLFDKAFPLPLGEDEADVVWFGVIHQDTDHLNMHIWYAKESRETRPEMMHKYGEPKGVIDFRIKKQAESKFRYELESDAVKLKRANVYEAVGEYRSGIKQDTLTKLDNSYKYKADLQEIFRALPQDLRGRWKVGNTDSLVTDDKSRMGKANRHMNTLIDKLLSDELKDDYAAFKASTYKMDQMMKETYGEQHKGQQKWSEMQDKRLRKELANGIYRQFNENFKEGNQLDGAFQKKESGNFEKIRRKHGVGVPTPNAQSTSTLSLGTSKKLSCISKQMAAESRKEIQRMHKLMAEAESASQNHSVSDESLSRNI